MATSVSTSATVFWCFLLLLASPIAEMFFVLCGWSLPVVREVISGLADWAPWWRSRLCLRASAGVSLLEIFLLSLPFWAAAVWLSGAKCPRGLQCTFVWFCWPDWSLVLFSFRISSGCLTFSFCGLELKLWSLFPSRGSSSLLSAGDRQTFQTHTHTHTKD